MRLLIISNNTALLSPESAARKQLLEYEEVFESVHITVMNKRDKNTTNERLGERIWLYPSASRWSISPLFLFDSLKVVRSQLVFQSSLQVDAVIGTTPFFTGFIAWLIARRYKKPLVLFVNENFLSKYFVNTLSDQLWKWLGIFITHKAHGLITETDALRDLLKKKVGENAHVATLAPYSDITSLTNTRALEEVRERFSQFNLLLLSIVPPTHDPQTRLAVDVAWRVAHKYPGAGLIMVGNNIDASFALKYAEKKGFEDRLVLIEQYDDIASYIQLASLLLVVSPHDNIRTRLIQAAALGTPIVVPETDVTKNLSERTREIISAPTDDNVVYTRKVTDLLESPEDKVYFKINSRDEILEKLVTSDKSYPERLKDELDEALTYAY